ncbi:acetyl-coenzyme A synthetase N-terminal domain-containing protein, partial [Streptomyces sp. NPDC005180]
MTTPHPTPYPEPFFTPDPKTAARSRIADFARWAARHQGAEGIQDPTDYRALYRWSVTDLEGFWAAVWDYFDIDATTEHERVLAEETMPGARWFPGATLNYGHHALRNLQPDAPAITALDESG